LVRTEMRKTRHRRELHVVHRRVLTREHQPRLRCLTPVTPDNQPRLRCLTPVTDDRLRCLTLVTDDRAS
jgi:hypothetical protein